MPVICYVKKKNGKYRKCKSNDKKDGGKFKVKGSKTTYLAPQFDKYEILELRHWLGGTKQYAFYNEGHPTPICFNGDQRQVSNPDDDAEFLAGVIKRALWEAGQMDTKINAALGAQGFMILLLVIHWMW